MKTCQVKIVTLPKSIVYYRHGTINTMNDLVLFVLAAGEEVKKNNPTLKCTTPEYCYVKYCANEYKEKDVEV